MVKKPTADEIHWIIIVASLDKGYIPVVLLGPKTGNTDEALSACNFEITAPDGGKDPGAGPTE